ncbi:tetraacyldisaccharide 4'-kinase [Antarcticibacterium flavum]|uniref:Tetraacyldisaccharide 4'-kinase n=1 Tax=Antarcticibacterium flavum TaxID=2058175 RepID=A0A5B7X4I7_9FLAO|nr:MULTISPECIES: tetraacyldisaccharide 4'-kinase [Antarcticibacterium]MCM4160018.1 tetraacyldisaccharide 4'-kinase [Antarcticibacterium sp. W02-3]QCY70394.1 tetraacyldisaccharide 4'-kinase [Antarcticibacterium flavum]
MVKPRKFLLPFSLLYGGVMKVRNILYDRGVLESSSFSTPVICVGNLSVGGTGKTPMIEYIIRLLHSRYSIATLSRGYGRKTSGYIQVTGNEDAGEVGDEPMQFKNKFPEVFVAVDENRRNGISQLINNFKPEVILLDDAFQHRRVNAGYNILLTAYNNMYTDDLVLPAGNLREPIEGASRAQVVVVTKCPATLGIKERKDIAAKLNLKDDQRLFFSYIKYGEELMKGEKTFPLEFLKTRKFTLLTGIANPLALVNFLHSRGFSFEHLKFPDHHNFSPKELEEIKAAELVVTTEKDYMRLKDMSHPGLYYLPIQTEFLENKEDFNKGILNFIHEK